MKKIKFSGKYIFFVVLAGITAYNFSCGGTTDSQVKGQSYRSEGWVDDDTFRVTVMGLANQNIKRQAQKRILAKESALILAQKRIIEKMIGSNIRGASAVKDGESAGMVVTKEFEGMVKGGSIVNEKYTEEDDCEITYEIQSKGLKKKAQVEIDRIKEK